MCGISGAIDRRRETSAEGLRAAASAMCESLAHRGPDGQAIWVDAPAGIALGHRRLAIIDLSPTGTQPMVSADGRFVIVYNGEVFNFAELRDELAREGARFRGGSDTEVILEGCVRWGLGATVRRLVGMFAFGLWDRRTQTLSLVRDRLGIKPLYYLVNDRLVAFASQLKALRACPGWTPSIDRDTAAAYFRFAYVPHPATIYREVRKLPPAHILTLAPGKPASLAPYWDMRDVATHGQRAWRKPPDPREAVDRLDALLRDAVRRRMISDVPLGALLSGGIDSSTVAALMQAQSDRPVRTFSIGFREDGYNEADHAKAVAAHLGTDHTELYVEPGHALAAVPRLAEWFDEPFADSSQIPTYLVAELTRRHVTVALSGDGGDEVFAGYNRYVWADALWRRMRHVPRSLRTAAASFLCMVPPAAWDRIFAAVPARIRPRQPGDKLHKLAGVLAADSPDDIYRGLVSHWPAPAAIVPGAHEPEGIVRDDTVARDIPDFTARMQFLDTVTYLPDDVLTKVDRATMAVGLEGRVPLLDHRVVEYAWTLPPSLKMANGQSKWILRQVLARYVPESLTDRPKMGFAAPIDAWLRGPLRDWAEDLLSPSALAAGGMLRPEPVSAMWRAHLSGARNYQHPLWIVLMFQAWRRRWA